MFQVGSGTSVQGGLARSNLAGLKCNNSRGMIPQEQQQFQEVQYCKTILKTIVQLFKGVYYGHWLNHPELN